MIKIKLYYYYFILIEMLLPDEEISSGIDNLLFSSNLLALNTLDSAILAI